MRQTYNEKYYTTQNVRGKTPQVIIFRFASFFSYVTFGNQ
jgi:hypothetical protein